MNAPLKAVVLLSGGLDSMLVLAELVAKPVQEVERVHALIFDYGQSSREEISCAVKLCTDWGVPFTVRALAIDRTDTHAEIPARNLIFIAQACAEAMQLGFNAVALGAEPDSTYTDSSIEFLEKARETTKLFGVDLIAPVKTMRNKLALLKRALELGVPLHLCHSSRSNKVDGECKTSRLFLDSIEQIFPHYLSAPEILHELSKLQFTALSYSRAKTYFLRYGENRSFKYPAALFSVLGRAEFAPLDHNRESIPVYSTGSWKGDLAAVMAIPAISRACPRMLRMYHTSSLELLTTQQINTNTYWAAWGMKQALSPLRRPRYSKHIACRITQGHLAETLCSMGYQVEAPAYRSGWLLETDPQCYPERKEN